MKSFLKAIVTASLLTLCGVLSASTLSVGPNGQYATPCAASKVATDGDVIEIDASGSYNGDVCRWEANNLTIQGINGRPHIDADGNSSEGKAIWVVQGNDTEIDNIEFSGAKVSSSNGAGIRFEGHNLIVRNCYFHDNQDGVLTDVYGIGNILIEYTEFAYNGAGDGESHNMYINHADSFTLQYCYSHHSKVGHLVKSRAINSYILYNRLSDESSGTASYEIDLPSGGTAYIIGNVIEQGPNSPNQTIISYLEESQNQKNLPNPNQDLYVVNNTIVNDASGGTFIHIDPSVSVPALIENNIFWGPGTPTTQANANLITNLMSTDPLQFVDYPNLNYRLAVGSLAIDAGSQPGAANGYALLPASQYIHAACESPRLNQGLIDIGAYETPSIRHVQCASYTDTQRVWPKVTLSPTSIVAGGSTGFTVILSQPAPQGGTPVTVFASSGDINALTTVTIPAGQSSTTVPVSSNSIFATETAQILAFSTGVASSTLLTLTPAPPNVAGIVQSSQPVVTFAVNLTGPAPAGGATVVLSSSDPTIIQVPGSVLVPQGALSVSFNVLTGPGTVPSTATLTASSNGTSQNLAVTVYPPVLYWLGSRSPIVKGGTTATLIPYVTGVAPMGGLTVSLQSSNPALVPVPATAVIPAGSSQVDVDLATGAVTSNTTVVFTATYQGVSQQATVTLTP